METNRRATATITLSLPLDPPTRRGPSACLCCVCVQLCFPFAAGSPGATHTCISQRHFYGSTEPKGSQADRWWCAVVGGWHSRAITKSPPSRPIYSSTDAVDMALAVGLSCCGACGLYNTISTLCPTVCMYSVVVAGAQPWRHLLRTEYRVCVCPGLCSPTVMPQNSDRYRSQSQPIAVVSGLWCVSLVSMADPLYKRTTFLVL